MFWLNIEWFPAARNLHVTFPSENEAEIGSRLMDKCSLKPRLGWGEGWRFCPDLFIFHVLTVSHLSSLGDLKSTVATRWQAFVAGMTWTSRDGGSSRVTAFGFLRSCSCPLPQAPWSARSLTECSHSPPWEQEDILNAGNSCREDRSSQSLQSSSWCVE